MLLALLALLLVMLLHDGARSQHGKAGAKVALAFVGDGWRRALCVRPPAPALVKRDYTSAVESLRTNFQNSACLPLPPTSCSAFWAYVHDL